MKTVDELKAAYPELVAQIIDATTTQERKRIQDIEDIALPGFDKVVNAAKFLTPATAADVAMSIVAEQKKQGDTYLTAMEKDVQDSGLNKVKAGGHEGANDKTNPYDAAVDRVLPANK